MLGDGYFQDLHQKKFCPPLSHALWLTCSPTCNPLVIFISPVLPDFVVSLHINFSCLGHLHPPISDTSQTSLHIPLHPTFPYFSPTTDNLLTPPFPSPFYIIYRYNRTSAPQMDILADSPGVQHTWGTLYLPIYIMFYWFQTLFTLV